MAEREQIRKPSTERSDDEVDEVPVGSEKGDQLKAELDDLLDEIDEVLETNAEDFVRNFVQKGGQ
ncbi:MAG: ubiquitin-like protein Pup [Acidimicrobiales bacterium]|jgi:ubiquitin-like protein Pup|nr:ubiquitin-like protein Pup [Acidimicrobiales bacterium]